MINSPVLRAEPLRFSEEGVRDVVRTVLLPYWNAFSFFTTYASADGITSDDLAAAPPLAERSEIDRWILSVLQSLVQKVNEEMEAYRLYNVVPPILDFIDDLTNWYIRRSRRRFWAKRAGDDRDKLAAFATLYEVLVTFSTVAAPVLPFITEEIYQQLVPTVDPAAPQSIHHTDFPSGDPSAIDANLEAAMDVVRRTVNLGRGLRKQEELRVRQPLSALTVVSRDADVRRAVLDHSDLIREELNVKRVEVETDESQLVTLSAKANFKSLGPRLGKDTKIVAAAIAQFDHDTVTELLDGGGGTVEGVELGVDDIVVERAPRPGFVVAADGDVTVAIDTAITDELASEGLAREFINRVQAARRDSGLEVTDRVHVRYHTPSETLASAIAAHADLISHRGAGGLTFVRRSQRAVDGSHRTRRHDCAGGGMTSPGPDAGCGTS